MNYFTNENTNCYTAEQLKDMNKLFDEIWKREVAEFPQACQKSLADRFLSEYENKLASQEAEK